MTLVFHQQSQTTSWDVWALPLEGERKPTLLLGTPGVECCGVLSPDGRFLAYVSDESGRAEVLRHALPRRRPQVAGLQPGRRLSALAQGRA